MKAAGQGGVQFPIVIEQPVTAADDGGHQRRGCGRISLWLAEVTPLRLLRGGDDRAKYWSKSNFGNAELDVQPVFGIHTPEQHLSSNRTTISTPG